MGSAMNMTGLWYEVRRVRFGVRVRVRVRAMNFVPDCVLLADFQSPKFPSGTFSPRFTSPRVPECPSIFRPYEGQNVPRPNFTSLEISLGMYAMSLGNLGLGLGLIIISG